MPSEKSWATIGGRFDAGRFAIAVLRSLRSFERVEICESMCCLI